MLANGDGGEKNLAQADEWFRKAAEQNHRDAQFRLAVASLAGQGMETNDVEGLHWLRRAADGGWPLAEYVLGSYYSTGKHGILKDPEQSVRWIQRSAGGFPLFGDLIVWLMENELPLLVAWPFHGYFRTIAPYIA